MRTYARTLLVCLLNIGAAAGQERLSRLEGKLIVTGSADALWVEIYDNPGHTLTDRAPVARDGSFTVNAVSTQLYEVRVLTSRGEQILREVTQFRHGAPVEFRLPAAPYEGHRPGGPVSVTRLSHKPAKMTRRLMKEADSLAGDGNLSASVERLQQVLTADPRWFEAWNNLGSRRLLMGHYAEAAASFRQALAIDAGEATVHSNLGLAYLFLRQPAQAEEAGRRALQLEPGSARAAYVAGLALLQQEKRVAEALQLLRESAAAVPRALLAVAEWRCRHDDFAGCEAELRAFLRTPRGPNHEAAEKWLATLRQRPGGR